jgi:hypothetical protein
LFLAQVTNSQPSGSLVLDERDVFTIGLGLLVIVLVVVMQPWLLARSFRAARRADQKAPTDDEPESFFEVPYVTWFLIHHGVAVMAIVAIVLLGLDNVIDKGTVSALLGSLFGYVLGSSATSKAKAGPTGGEGGSTATPGATPAAPTTPAEIPGQTQPAPPTTGP